MPGEPDDQETQALLRSRFRSTAFAALGADVAFEDLVEDLNYVRDAETRRRAAEVPAPRPALRLVHSS